MRPTTETTTTIRYTDKDGEVITVSKHVTGKLSCSCKSWRMNQSLPGRNDCTHIHKAKRKGL